MAADRLSWPLNKWEVSRLFLNRTGSIPTVTHPRDLLNFTTWLFSNNTSRTEGVRRWWVPSPMMASIGLWPGFSWVLRSGINTSKKNDEKPPSINSYPESPRNNFQAIWLENYKSWQIVNGLPVRSRWPSLCMPVLFIFLHCFGVPILTKRIDSC